ncbi:unnamed protein product [Dibothriocephalus latus]|uniref:Uncharacterized protein n=1 Tax=Dibothriocephalus latus TaxID=60516 RepID=A0A3P6PL52_DIBLA|nr:unnamed protein product [Dibothriocephalus latus]
MLFINCSLDDTPNFDIIGKHGDIAVQSADKIFHVKNEQSMAENGTLRNTTLNRILRRLIIIDMDSLRAASWNICIHVRSLLLSPMRLSV